MIKLGNAEIYIAWILTRFVQITIRATAFWGLGPFKKEVSMAQVACILSCLPTLSSNSYLAAERQHFH